MATTSTLSLLNVSLNTILPILPNPLIPNFTFDIFFSLIYYFYYDDTISDTFTNSISISLCPLMACSSGVKVTLS